mgnify:CR=1 FL=1|tara:strand:- start:463 stop:1149 length:687 start_codon:yes stop_codon:yes gene_type:complete
MFKVFAHRGVHNSRTDENTEQAFLAALNDASIGGIECDVRYSGDNQLVVAHDDDLWVTRGQHVLVGNSKARYLEKNGYAIKLQTVLGMFRDYGEKTVVIDYKTEGDTLRAIQQVEQMAVAFGCKCDIIHLVWQPRYDFTRPGPTVYFAAGQAHTDFGDLQRRGYAGVGLHYRGVHGDTRIQPALNAGLLVNLYGDRKHKEAMMDLAGGYSEGQITVTTDVQQRELRWH